MTVATTVGELRQLLAESNLPDDAKIYPEWGSQGAPDDHEPGIEIEGITICDDPRRKGTPWLSVLVGLFYLEDDEGEDDETD